ncbi:tyrosine-protein phosphatase [Pseudomonadota bacterium]|nr:tyrosine-protein phosphatase [Pseudomonadota bacterium]
MKKATVKNDFNRFYAWYDMMIKDHGFLRLCYHNFHKIDDNVYRSNMPTPQRIKKYSKLGIRTIINLRGVRKDGGWLLENEACQKHNIKLIDFRARSRAAPEKEMITKADKLFQSIEYPVLIHCKSGADRAGIMCAIYMLTYAKALPSIAKEQLSWKFLHVKWAKPGVLDAFVEEYGKEYKKNKIKFMEWIKKQYDPYKLETNFRSVWWANRLLDDVLKRE